MNINDYVYVRLTEHGEQQWNENWKRVDPLGVPTCIRKSAYVGKEWYRFQMHELMHTFGKSCYNGSNTLPFVNNEILFEEPK